MARTLHQKRTHPSYVEGCFGCRVGTIGYDGKTLTQTKVVDEPMSITVPRQCDEPKTVRVMETRNTVTEHRDGRTDVTVRPPTVKLVTTTREEF